MTIEELRTKKKVLIIGYGVEGKAAHAFLTKCCPGVAVGIADQKDGKDYLQKQKEYELAIKSPGIRPELVTIPYTTGTSIFFANKKGKVIGVTGTKGKSTTATLIYEMLKKADFDVHLGGNVGKPAIELLDILTKQSWTVLELSSFQLQDITMSPHISVLLRIIPEHLDYHKNMEDYIDAKRNILRFQSSDDYAVINRDYPVTNESDVYTEGKVFYVSRERETNNACFVLGGKVIIQKDENDNEIIKTAAIGLTGKHNLENVCAAAMAANLAGVGTKDISAVLKKFKGLEHRLSLVGQAYGITFYNDSLATVPDATIEAIEAFDPQVETLIAGGYDRGIDFKNLGEYLAKSSVQNLILFPPAGEHIWQSVVAAGGADRLRRFDTTSMAQAVLFASEETSPGKICLLSPAAASFGMFKNYKDRGEQFKKAVLGLA
ncbi:MAG: UDP-N-acetylmuramoyl-L-alanine--D-glutamate ligase [Candidatus Levyibacteriota bacterium]